MDPQSIRILLGSLAEQQYMFHLLLKILVEKKILDSGEVTKRYSEKDRFQFSHDLLEELIARGLKIDGNSPSSSPQEPPDASSPATTEATGLASGKKS